MPVDYHCETLVAKRDEVLKRKIEHPCNALGARWRIVGSLGTIEQNFCWKHKREAAQARPEWIFEEIKSE